MKTLKHITLLFVAVVCLGLASCAENQLQKAIEETNKMMPIKIARNFEITNVTDDGQYVVYRYELAENIYDMDQIRQYATKEAMQQQLQTMLQSNPDGKAFFDIVKESGRGLKFEYVGTPSGDTCEVTLENDEL